VGLNSIFVRSVLVLGVAGVRIVLANCVNGTHQGFLRHNGTLDTGRFFPENFLIRDP